MGTLVYSMQVSLDGYVADATGEFASWARPDEQVLTAINNEHSKVSTYLLGRRMYQMMAVWETSPEVIKQSPQSTEFARIWQGADRSEQKSYIELELHLVAKVRNGHVRQPVVKPQNEIRPSSGT